MKLFRKINILPEDLTNKIAAGEVVDRPASVVKELIENSIDAGADEITIILKDAGKGQIQIVDNGTGMNRDDSILAIQRHTTSKISTYDDLHNIHTLGFRGEALASIASVARMELKTALQDQHEGTMLKIEGGAIQDVSSVGHVRGTSIAVKNLFFNTPARRKFLKTNETEYRYILNTINRFTLAYPEIKFELYHNDKKIFDLAAVSLEQRLIEVLGTRYKGKTIEVKDETSFIKIDGIIGNQDAAKKSRGDQYLFLNGRYIVNRALNHAIVSAYGTVLPRGEFPLYVVFLEIDPRRIDVNVHPTKMEVKFADERLIYDLLRKAVKKTISTDHIIAPFSYVAHQEITPLKPKSVGIQTSMPLSELERGHSYRYEDIIQPFSDKIETAPTEHIEQEQKQEPQTNNFQTGFERAHTWQIHNQYIISEIKSGIVIIDQHAAHERILYEKALRNFERKSPASQQLLFPITVELTPEFYSYLKEILPFLEQLGFMIKGFGGNTVVIEGVPSGLKMGSQESVLNEILDEFKKNKSNSLDIRDNVAKSFACKSAIKSGDKLTLQEMNTLIDQLFATQSPYFCPHGRPVIINVTINELDKRFGRI